MYNVVELGTVMPVVVTRGLAVVVDTTCAVVVGAVAIVVLDVVIPVRLP